MENQINNKYEHIIKNYLSRLVPLQLRFKIINYINDEYFKEVQKNLPSRFLNMLGSWCVKEIYKDKTSNKVAVTEYPFLSLHQYKRRMDKQVQLNNMEALEVLAYHRNNNTLKVDKKGAVADA